MELCKKIFEMTSISYEYAVCQISGAETIGGGSYNLMEKVPIYYMCINYRNEIKVLVFHVIKGSILKLSIA